MTFLPEFFKLSATIYLLQQQGLFRNKTKNPKVKTAEKKLFFVLAYYAIFIAIVLTYYSVNIRDYANFTDEVKKYFVCEAFGYNSDKPCPKNYEQYTYGWLEAVAYILLGFLPAVNLIFVINFQHLKDQCLRRVCAHGCSSSSSRVKSTE